MTTIAYHIIYSLFYLLSLLPLRVLYWLSDAMCFIIYRVVKYRKRLVRKQLADSFPEKGIEERLKIEHEFYAWLCDYFVESIKLTSISTRQMRERMRFEGVESVNKAVADGKSCALYLGHYCNWEWVTSIPLDIDENVACGQIYHVLENKVFDRLFLKLRGRFRAESIPMAETLRRIVAHRKEGKSMIIGFIADQGPFWNNIHYWTEFMNHDTPVFTGSERIARKMDFTCFYLDLRRESRGHYVARYKLMTEHPAKLKEFELTEMYFRELEATIRRQPQFWLWTHNRWKRTREEWLRRMNENGHGMDLS